MPALGDLEARVRGALGQQVAAGQAIAAGWIPVDMYCLGESTMWAVELANDDVRCRLRVRIVRGDAPALERVDDLAIGYEIFGAHRDSEAASADAGAVAAASGVVRILRAQAGSAGESTGGSTGAEAPHPNPHPNPPPAGGGSRVEQLPAGGGSRVGGVGWGGVGIASPRLRAELAAIERISGRVARYFGAPLVVAPVPDAPVESYTLCFPAIPAHRDTGPTLFLAVPEPLRRRKIIRDTFGALGYEMHEAGLLRTVPTPSSYCALRDASGLAGHGFEPHLAPMTRIRVPVEQWLRSYIDGAIAINVPTSLFTRVSVVAFALGKPTRFWCEHLTAIGHDMSTHILPTHRIPHERIGTLGARMARALDRVARRRNPLSRRAAVAELVLFYEEDLVRHCIELWHFVAVPGELTELFCRPDHWQRLIDRMDARIARAGLAS